MRRQIEIVYVCATVLFSRGVATWLPHHLPPPTSFAAPSFYLFVGLLLTVVVHPTTRALPSPTLLSHTFTAHRRGKLSIFFQKGSLVSGYVRVCLCVWAHTHTFVRVFIGNVLWVCECVCVCVTQLTKLTNTLQCLCIYTCMCMFACIYMHRHGYKWVCVCGSISRHTHTRRDIRTLKSALRKSGKIVTH